MDAATKRAARWGRRGLAGGVVPAVIALIGAATHSGAADGVPPFYEILIFYLVAGAALGALVGLLLPLARRPIGAIVVGMICAFALYSTVVLMADGIAKYRPGFPLFMGIVVGGPVGFGIWRRVKRDGVAAPSPSSPPD